MNENWKDIPGLEGKYQASDHGNIRSLDRTVKIHGKSGTVWTRKFKGVVLTPFINDKGYKVVCKLFGRKSKTTVHRLIGITWIANPNAYLCINHKNHDRLDNRVENIEWCSQSQNIQHAWDSGRMNAQLKKHKSRRGSAVKSAKLTDSIVRQIHELNNSGLTQQQIAEKFSVAQTTISRVLLGATWVHVT